MILSESCADKFSRDEQTASVYAELFAATLIGP